MTEEKVGNLFQDTSSKEMMGTKWLQANFQALQEESASLQDPINIMQIKIHNWNDANFPVKIREIDAITL